MNKSFYGRNRPSTADELMTQNSYTKETRHKFKSLV
jgi:hypothetical protein